MMQIIRFIIKLLLIKTQQTGEIHPLAGWSLLEPVEEEEDQKNRKQSIEVVKLDEKLRNKR